MKNEIILPQKIERPGREIRIEETFCKNKNITGRVGTIDDKNCPKTVYLSIGFWVDIKGNSEDDNMFDEAISKKFSRELSGLYKKDLKNILQDNKYFPFYNDNIYVYDFPNNLNYNNKKSFVSIELSLHTINCLSKNKLPLKNKNKTKLFDELLRIYSTLSKSKLLSGKSSFSIHRAKD